MVISIKKTFLGVFNLINGLLLGLLALEGILNLNPTLLFRGTGVNVPVDIPLRNQIYDVHYSDGALYYWQRELFSPILSEDDRIEAHVEFQTDEFGFPNQPPIPEIVDIVVLGQSFSMGAQASLPWPKLLSEQHGLTVLNLSQPGSDLVIKQHFLLEYGFRHHPRWVIVEVLPSLDILPYSEDRRDFLVNRLITPIIWQFARDVFASDHLPDNHNFIYPLTVEMISGKTVELSFYNYFLSALTVDANMLQNSVQWTDYQKGINRIKSLINQRDVCMALLYIPTKADVYLPLFKDIQILQPLVPYIKSWRLDESNRLLEDVNAPWLLESLPVNAETMRNSILEFAEQNQIILIDPTTRLREAANLGIQPYMRYDTHWSDLGHQIVAQTVFEGLINTPCK